LGIAEITALVGLEALRGGPSNVSTNAHPAAKQVFNQK
jgi:hypothetical protein